MTRDDIIRMAREAGIERCTCNSATCNMLHSVTTFDHLGRFASLVAAVERERTATELRRLQGVNQELLEALKELIAGHGGTHGCHRHDGRSIAARAAIAKAEGTTP